MRSTIFFSKAAVVTFGGAYAVLAYIAQYPGAAVMAGGALVAHFVLRWGMMRTLGGGALAGLLRTLLARLV